MSGKFRNKYRISSTRLQSWNYGWKGIYFITICTKNRQEYFGSIINSRIELTCTGVLAYIFWNEIKNHTENVIPGEFIIMPNHIHGLLNLTGNNTDIKDTYAGRDKACLVSTATNIMDKTIGQQRFQNQGKNTISSVVGSYKSVVSKYANRLGYDFAWQSRFFDRIIRDTRELDQVKKYIINNPANWRSDSFCKNGISKEQNSV